MGAHYPGLVHGVVAAVPSGVTTSPCPHCDYPVWTLHGRTLPFTTQFDTPNPAGAAGAVIPVERIDGPVFLVCGGADKTWSSCRYARAIMGRLAAHPTATPTNWRPTPRPGTVSGTWCPTCPEPGSRL